MAAPPAAGQSIEFDNDCGVARWWCACTHEGANACNGNIAFPIVTNWSEDRHPGELDEARIEAVHGRIDFFSNSATVQSLTALGGLDLDGRALTLKGASGIKDLALSNNGSLKADFTGFGLFVALGGESEIHADLVGPGTFETSGRSELSFGRLRGGATLKSHEEATVATSHFDLGDGAFHNLGGLYVGPGVELRGGDGLLVSASDLTLDDGAIVTPKYRQTGGTLRVASGTATLRSKAIDFAGGTVELPLGSALDVRTDLADNIDGAISGTEFQGGGALILRENFTVTASTLFDLGYGSLPGPGADRGGGLNLRAALFLEAPLFNSGRLRLQAGIVAGSNFFLNSALGTVYTFGQGSATFLADVDNHGRFFLVGPDLVLGSGTRFSNGCLTGYALFVIHAGNVTGAGGFDNCRIVELEGRTDGDPARPDAGVVSSIGTTFFNDPDLGAVIATRGTLRFDGPLRNLEDGVLGGGFWEVGREGVMVFPEPITTLDGARVALNGRIDALDALTTLRGSSSLGIGTGTTATPAGPELELGEDEPPVESVIPELRGITVLAIREPGGPAAAAAADAPRVVVPLLRNRSGRVLPSQRGAVGALVLEGDYEQEAGGRLWIEATPSAADLLEVTAAARLAGKLEVEASGEFPPGTVFTVLRAAGGLTGTFDEVVTFDDIEVAYTDQEVRLTVRADGSGVFADGFESGELGAWSHRHP